MPLLQGRGVVLQAPVLSPGFPLDGEDTKVLLYLPVYTLAPHPPTVTRKSTREAGAWPPRFRCSVSQAQKGMGKLVGRQ